MSAEIRKTNANHKNQDDEQQIQKKPTEHQVNGTNTKLPNKKTSKKFFLSVFFDF